MTASTPLAAPWATAQDLPVGANAPTPPVPPTTWDDVLLSASETLYLLTGCQWRGVAQQRAQVFAEGRLAAPLLPSWVPLPVVLPCSAWSGLGARGPELTTVALPSTPVISIDQVTVESTVLDPSLYLCDSAGLLERTDHIGWPVDGSLFVAYTAGVVPPAAGKRAAVSLAVELAKAGVGGSGSKLQNLVTQTTREGVTVAAVNLRDAFTAGHTGLPDVDLWITANNPHKMRRRAHAWSPDHGRVRRVTS